jgi:hypothetical protein
VEEECCDQIVLRTRVEPGAYARGLLKTVEFLVGTGRPVPALASGVGEAHQMEERLTMIMNERPPSRPSRTVRVVLTVLALGLLLVFPTWTERSTAAADSPTPDSQEAQAAGDEAELRENMRSLDRRARQLEQELQQIRDRQVVLKHEWQRQQLEEEIEGLRGESDAVDGMDPQDKADQLRDRLHQLERQAELQDRAIELERRSLEETAASEMLLRARMLELEKRTARGDEREAARLMAEAYELQRRLKGAMTDTELDREHERRLATDLERRLYEREAVLARMKRELAELSKLAIDLERDGRDEESREVETQIEELRRQIKSDLGAPR